MSIKLSAATIAILENYAAINKGILLKPGKKLKTLSQSGSSAASATIEEDFPLEMPLHDILNFLNVLSLFNEPVLEFNKPVSLNSKSPLPFVTITDATDKSSSTRFFGCPIDLIKDHSGTIHLAGTCIKFKLTESQLAVLVKATAVLKKPEWAFISDGKQIKIVTYDSSDVNSSDYSLIVEGNPNGVVCTMILSFENIRLLKGNYEVAINDQLAQFTNTDRVATNSELVYWIGAEANSKFKVGDAASAGN